MDQLVRDLSILSQDRSRRINDSQYSSISNLQNHMSNAHCRILGSRSIDINRQTDLSNLDVRINRHQYSRYLQMRNLSGISVQSKPSFINDTRSQYVMNNHVFRRPNDRSQIDTFPSMLGRFGQIQHISKNLTGNMSVASNNPAPSESLEQINSELSKLFQVLDFLKKDTGISLVEEVKIIVRSCVLETKKKVRKHFINSVSSVASGTSISNLTRSEMQHIQNWLNSNTAVEPTRPFHTQSDSSSLLNSANMQQPNLTAIEPTRPFRTQSNSSSVFTSVSTQQPNMTGVHEQVIGDMNSLDRPRDQLTSISPNLQRQQSVHQEIYSQEEPVVSTSIADSMNIRSRNKNGRNSDFNNSLLQTLTLNVAVREKKQNKPTTINTKFKKPLAVRNKGETPNQKRSLTTSPQMSEKFVTQANAKATSTAKENSDKSNSRKNKNKENISISVIKTKENCSSKEPKKPAIKKAMGSENTENMNKTKGKQQTVQLESKATNCDKVNCSYITSRGRQIMPVKNYWEVAKKPVSSIILKDDKNSDKKKDADDSNKLELNVILREKKQTATKKKVKNPVAVPQEKENSKQNVLTSPPKKKNSHATRTKALCDSNTTVENPKQVLNNGKTTKKNNKSAKKGKENANNEVKKNNDSKIKNNMKEQKVEDNVIVEKQVKKLPASKRRKRKSVPNEPVSFKKRKVQNKNPDKNVAGYPFQDSFQLFESQKTPNPFCFEYPSPGAALRSIRKKIELPVGTETPPTKYLNSILNNTGNTTVQSVLSEEERAAPKNYAAERIAKKMKKASAVAKQRKPKPKVKAKADTSAIKLMNEVLHGKGKISKKVEQVFRTKLKYADESSDSWDEDSNDSYSDLL